MSDRRRRLSPEERREQLLDEARDIVERDGVAACTVDAVSQAAEVTPQLVHKYFGTRPSLLQALFQREDERYQVLVHAQIEEADTFEDLVRVFVTANFDQLSRATAIGQLRLAPEVAALRDERRRAGSRRAERVLVRAMAAEYSASSREMEFLLRLGSAASIEAGNLASQRRSGDRTTHIDNTVRFILAGVRELTGPSDGETRPDTAEDSCT